MKRPHTYNRVRARLALGLFAALSMLALAAPTHAARTDVVILHNGDHITGEVKKLDYGKLEYKTDDMDNIYIEWEKIHHVSSVNRFEVIDTYGIRRWGSLGRTDVPQEVVIMTSVGADTLDLLTVVRITRIKETFWRRLKGSVSIGFSYTRATETAEGTLGGDTKYRGEKYGGSLTYDAYITDQAEKRTSRYSFGFGLEMPTWSLMKIAVGSRYFTIPSRTSFSACLISSPSVRIPSLRSVFSLSSTSAASASRKAWSWRNFVSWYATTPAATSSAGFTPSRAAGGSRRRSLS